jgi:predicted nucleic acid-binding protein
MRESFLSQATVSDLIIFDTSIFIDDLRTGRHQRRVGALRGLIRTSSVVLAELWRGATKPAEREFLRRLGKNHPILTPTEKNWIESGEILGRMNLDRGFAPEKLRDLHFDVLVALTTRACGGCLITSNRIDFETIREYRKFELEVW